MTWNFAIMIIIIIRLNVTAYPVAAFANLKPLWKSSVNANTGVPLVTYQLMITIIIRVEPYAV